jgi:hypothetical protein
MICGDSLSPSAAGSNRNPLHLVEAHLVASAIVELCGAGRGVVRHGGRVFERAAVLQVRRDSGRPEGMIADPGLDASGAGAKPPAVRRTAANRIHGVRTAAACRLFASGEAVASFPRSSQAQYYSTK